MPLPVTAQLSARAALGRLDGLAAALGPAVERGMRAAGVVYLRDQAARFDRLSGGGGEWAKLQPETVRRKGSSAILKDTGALRRSLEPGATNNVLDVVKTPGGYRLSAGTRDPKARWHQSGAGSSPVRRVIGEPSAGALRTMRDVIATEVRRALTQAAKR
jgi:hypothetical protein